MLSAAVLFATAPAQVLWRVEPSPRILDRRLISAIEPLAVQPRSDDIVNRLLDLLADGGYLDGGISNSGDTLVIRPGEKFHLDAIRLTTVTSAGIVIDKDLPEYRGRPADRAGIERIRQNIVSTYRDSGYYFATLHTERLSIHDHACDLAFRLITGSTITVERVRFKGLSRTSPELVRKLSRLNEGELLVPAGIDAAVRGIEAGGYLRVDSTPQLVPDKEYTSAEVLFHLSELKANSLYLGGGYLPRQGTMAGELIGRLDFRSLNLFGAGRRVGILFDRKDRKSSRVDFRFGQPLFIPDHLELGVHLTQVDFDSSYQSFSAEATVGLYLQATTRLSGGVSWSKTDPQSSQRASFRTLDGIFRYEAQRFDTPANPVRGRRAAFGLTYSHRVSQPQAAATAEVNNETLFAVDGERYFPLVRQVIVRLHAAANVRITSRDLIDYAEQFKLGGYGSLRGYRQDEFAGYRTVLGQTEIRLRPSADLAIFLFADMGYVYTRQETAPSSVGSKEFTRVGSGFGLYIGSQAARATLEIGWGQNDRIDTGKIHFGLTTLF